ncbi:glycoside hydrolase family 13 protein [Tessaracoccus antarcticus]|uniref:Alpha-glucosidase n=1 Tax=Tessaracoccus antarcticus TaxID=2479848 RepID=A0A3M0GKD5_9ACTN|nr:glycoside hydrolase family 13 protein [Tessaracoccus antarcticus]RMB57776.1 alpha-glucosidase [Tessaracoccus antarcticus]
MSSDGPWWHQAVIYQIYPKSFADGNGDGVGDLAGVRAHLPYLRDLGVDALWFTPWYVSPQADGGYDVTDHRDIDPVLGTLQEAEELILEALDMGMRSIIDVVANHVASDHRWFTAAVASAKGSPERARFWFRDGVGPGGASPPTGWVSPFGGGTWSRAPGGSDQWYLHLFSPGQPDLNWNHPEVRAEYEEILRFWFDRGVSGVRIDSAALLMKDPTLPEVGDDVTARGHPFEDRDEVHEIYRSWRKVADSYTDSKLLVGEVWLEDRDRLARYVGPDELHTVFGFDVMASPWQLTRLRAAIEDTLRTHERLAAPPAWVLGNHDVTRAATRYGRRDTGFSFADKAWGIETDVQLGRERARAMALLLMSLPGSFYIYQGEELGLDEVEDLPQGVLQDPMVARSGGTNPGRDGCRVPLPWRANAPGLGFSTVPPTAAPWLPQPSRWADQAVDVQQHQPHSTLALYRRALLLRRQYFAHDDPVVEWLDRGPDVLALRRGSGVQCIVNMGTRNHLLPAGDQILITSDSAAPGDTRILRPNTAVWWRSRPS